MQAWVRVAALCVPAMLAACGQVDQTQGSSGKTLCFDYYQRCVNRVFDNTPTYGGISASSCSASGCHQAGVGPGGAFKINPGLAPLSLTTPAQDRATQMYANFLSAKGSANLNDPRQSFIIKKPLVEVFHGGGPIFADATAIGVREFQFWISQNVDDEFGAQCPSLFNPPASTTCQF